MKEFGMHQHIDVLADTLSHAAERAKTEIEDRLNVKTFIGCVGGLALVSSGAHLLERNYIRALAYGGLGVFHLNQLSTLNPES